MEQSVKETDKIFEFAKMYEQLCAEELSYINVEAKLMCLFDSKRFAEMGISQIYKSHGHIISEEMCGKTMS